MYKLSERSQRNLSTCDIKLQRVIIKAIKLGIVDFTVIQGYRGEAEQNKAHAEGKSNARYGQSKHNLKPSQAVDIVPYPLDWEDTNRFSLLAGVILAVSKAEGVDIRWGGDWDRDGNLADNKFNDLPHFELM